MNQKECELQIKRVTEYQKLSAEKQKLRDYILDREFIKEQALPTSVKFGMREIYINDEEVLSTIIRDAIISHYTYKEKEIKEKIKEI